MLVRRFHITEGATTTAGGVVRASNKFSTINGAAKVLEGDPVDCPACGGQGVIKCVMPRLIDRYEGKEYALSGDLCICGCNPPPKLIAAQNISSQCFLVADAGLAEADGKQRTGNQGSTAAPHVESANQVDMRSIRFEKRRTGSPYANQPYRLELANEKVIQGTTDANGATRSLTPDERAALRTWQSGQQ